MSLAKLLAELPIPIVLAPMLGASTPEMALAVAGAGGLASFAAAGLAPHEIEPAVQTLQAQTNGLLNVNLLIAPSARPSADVVTAALARLEPWLRERGLPPGTPPNDFAPDFHGQLEAVVRARPKIASFTFDVLNAREVARLHQAGAYVIGTATTVAEAKAWAAAGADGICAQGFEAGGHRGHFLAETEASLVGTMALVPAIVAATGLPVIAAGGVMDGKGVAAALALGAAAVQMGTAFLLTDQSAISQPWRRALETARDDPTRLSRAYTGRPARGVENRFMREMRAQEADVPPYPVQNRLTQPLRAAAAAAGDAEVLSLWAGQGVKRAQRGDAGDLVQRWWAQAQAAAEGLAERTGR